MLRAWERTNSCNARGSLEVGGDFVKEERCERRTKNIFEIFFGAFVFAHVHKQAFVFTKADSTIRTLNTAGQRSIGGKKKREAEVSLALNKNRKRRKKEGYLLLLLSTELEVLATLKSQLHLVLAFLALHTQNDLLGGLGLLLEHGLGLSTETLLLGVVTALSLGEDGGLSGLVLRHLVEGVLSALLGGAEGLPGLGDVNLQK